MNMIRITMVILMALVSSSWASDTSAKSDLESALTKLDTGIKLLEQRAPDAKLTIREAAADLQRVMDEHQIETPGAYHALGNAYSLIGDQGHAVLAYKRGERIAPTNPMLHDSLERARAQVQIKVEPNAQHRIVRLLMSWRGIVPRSLLWGISVALFIIAWLLMTARVAFGSPKWFMPLAFWSIGLSLLPLAALSADWALYQKPGQVVITQNDVVARSGPDDSIYEPVYTEPLSAGVEGAIVEHREQWTKLMLADGTECWVPQRSFEPVMRPETRRQ